MKTVRFTIKFRKQKFGNVDLRSDLDGSKTIFDQSENTMG